MAIPWGTVVPFGILAVALAGFIRKVWGPPPRRSQALGGELGLEYRRNIWKGTTWWQGSWNRMPVQVVLDKAESPRIVVGAPGKEPRWMVMDRRLEEALVLKGEPDPASTGDPRFDERFTFRSYSAPASGPRAALTASMRDLVLKAAPETVTLQSAGLEYTFQERPTVAKSKTHLDAATELARLAGIGTVLTP